MRALLTAILLMMCLGAYSQRQPLPQKIPRLTLDGYKALEYKSVPKVTQEDCKYSVTLNSGAIHQGAGSQVFIGDKSIWSKSLRGDSVYLIIHQYEGGGVYVNDTIAAFPKR